MNFSENLAYQAGQQWALMVALDLTLDEADDMTDTAAEAIAFMVGAAMLMLHSALVNAGDPALARHVHEAALDETLKRIEYGDPIPDAAH